jgi:hypothetical protein
MGQTKHRLAQPKTKQMSIAQDRGGQCEEALNCFLIEPRYPGCYEILRAAPVKTRYE